MQKDQFVAYMKHLVRNVGHFLLTIRSFSWIAANEFFVFYAVQNRAALRHLSAYTEVLARGRNSARCILLVGTGFDSSLSSRMFSVLSLLYCLCWLNGVYSLQDASWDEAIRQRLGPHFSYEHIRNSQEVIFTMQCILLTTHEPWKSLGSLFLLEVHVFGNNLLV